MIDGCTFHNITATDIVCRPDVMLNPNEKLSTVDDLDTLHLMPGFKCKF